jgi:hypothetical protein
MLSIMEQQTVSYVPSSTMLLSIILAMLFFTAANNIK